MRALHEIYDFITGGSIVTPFGVAAAILAAFLVPAWGAQLFIVLVAATFLAAAFEKPT